MKSSTSRLAHVVIVDVVIETLLSEGVDLRDVTLDDFKERLKRTMRLMNDDCNLAAA